MSGPPPAAALAAADRIDPLLRVPILPALVALGMAAYGLASAIAVRYTVWGVGR